MNTNYLDPLGSYCGYLRKSREDLRTEQYEGYDTLNRHRKTLAELATKYGVSLTAFYEEVVSGDSIEARPQMQALIHDVDAGRWDGVFVMEVERLARGDTIDQGIVARSFKYSGTAIITPMKIYHPDDEFDEEYFEFSLYMSRKEYKTISRRMQAGRLRSVQDGKYVGNKPPYGYKITKIPDDSGFTLEIIPEQAETVRLIYSKYLDGMGMSSIANLLNDSGIPTQTGKQWIDSVIKLILSNPVYCGYVRWNRRKTEKKIVDSTIVRMRPINLSHTICKGIHEPIISQEDFDRVQAIRKTRKSIPQPKDRTLQNPFSGIMRCSKCGKLLTRRPYADAQKRTSMICTTRNCPTVGDFMDNIEQEFLDSMRILCDKYKFDYEPNNSEKKMLDTKMDAIRSMQKKLGDLEKQRDRLYEFLETGLYSEDIFRMRMKKLNASALEITGRLDEATKEYESLTSTAAFHDSFVPKCEYLLGHYEHLTVETKNSIIRELVSNIEYTKDTRNKRGHSHDINFTLDIYPRIPL